jgi:hypothetical protein
MCQARIQNLRSKTSIFTFCKESSKLLRTNISNKYTEEADDKIHTILIEFTDH